MRAIKRPSQAVIESEATIMPGPDDHQLQQPKLQASPQSVGDWPIDPDTIVRTCLAKYFSFPKTFHPSPRSNGIPQYAILSGIVLARRRLDALSKSGSDHDCEPCAECISLATGSKCLPETKLPFEGDVLHDSHAEVLARRGFVRWLIEEIQRFALENWQSSWLECDGEQFKLKDGVNVYLYVSTLPCGDASTYSLTVAQDPKMAALKGQSISLDISSAPLLVRGRNNYSALGVLRTKPGRMDSASTASMSCSDKIALWGFVGIQGALLMKHLSQPVYLDGIVVGEVNPELKQVTYGECERAFWRRFGSSAGLLEAPFTQYIPLIHLTSLTFPHSRLQTSAPAAGGEASASSESLCWIADSPVGHGRPEALVNGIKRGAGKKAESTKSRSLVSKAAIYDLYRTIPAPHVVSEPKTTYSQAKQESRLYMEAKKKLQHAEGPFAGWKVTGRMHETFC